MSRAYVPGAPPTARDRAASAGRALHRRKRALQMAMARVVAGRTDRQLERAPIGPIVIWALPLLLRAQFRPEYAVDLDGNDIDGTILLNLLRDGGRRRDQFEVALERRRCRVRRQSGGTRRPDATLTIGLADLLRMAAAATDALALVPAGRVAISGDTFLVARFPPMFRQPTRSVI